MITGTVNRAASEPANRERGETENVPVTGLWGTGGAGERSGAHEWEGRGLAMTRSGGCFSRRCWKGDGESARRCESDAACDVRSPLLFTTVRRHIVQTSLPLLSFLFDAMSLQIGSFDSVCSTAALVICPLVGPSGQGIEPNCYSRNVQIGSTLIFQPCELSYPATRALH